MQRQYRYGAKGFNRPRLRLKAEKVKAAFASTPTAGPSPLTDLQVSIALAARELRGKGLPPAQP